MSTPVTAEALFDALQEKISLEWAAGRGGADRIIQGAHLPNTASSLIGHLNLIHPHRIQVLGRTEQEYLSGLSDEARGELLTQLCSGQSDLIIIAKGGNVADDLRQTADETCIPVFVSRLPSQELVNNLQYFLGSLVSEKVTLHGVFMEIMGIGVLVAGDASIGKSELALELLSRGHRLIADDAPVFSRIAPDIISGSCPDILRDFLEVRGLGILNVRAMFGDSVVKVSKYLRLVLRLEKMSDEQLRNIDRLKGSRRTRTVLGIEIPEITLPVTPGRNLGAMAEAAVKNHILYLKGYDASAVFMERQQKSIENDAQ